MTFSQEVKKLLVESCASLKKPCCRRALLFGFLRYHKKTQNPPENQEKLIGQLKKEGYGEPTPDALSEAVEGCANCAASYLRGVFLACGTVSNPDSKSYQLELTVHTPEEAEALGLLLGECGMPPKTTVRGGFPVLYYKDSASIEDFLSYIGAQKAAFELMNVKILKELRNNANRLANCDAANIDKTVSAAQLQIHAVERLEASGQIAALPDELRTTARLRLENPEATLGELASLHTPPITKSGVNHRLKKLLELGSTPTEQNH